MLENPVPDWQRMSLGIGIAALALVLAHLASGCDFTPAPHGGAVGSRQTCADFCSPDAVAYWGAIDYRDVCICEGLR